MATENEIFILGVHLGETSQQVDHVASRTRGKPRAFKQRVDANPHYPPTAAVATADFSNTTPHLVPITPPNTELPTRMAFPNAPLSFHASSFRKNSGSSVGPVIRHL